MNFNSRKTWTLLGGIAGLLFVRSLPELPAASGAASRWRDGVWEGVGFGVGIGWGIVLGMNLLILGGQYLNVQAAREAHEERMKALQSSQSGEPTGGSNA